jgi:DHA1 family bicyclomycin/chloramphenicol resistance-like MFS transporter
MNAQTMRRRLLLTALTATSSLGLAASTIYMPSVLEIAHALGVSAAAVQFTFVAYLAAYAAGMLVWGPVSDHFGRRPVLAVALVGCVVSSLLCALSGSIAELIAARIAQGLATCAGVVVGRATTREVYGTDGAAKVIAGRALASTILQAAAPLLGAQLQARFGWRANFVAIALWSLVALLLAWRFVPETRARSRAPLRPGAMLSGYRRLIETRRFLGYAFAGSSAHAGFHVFAAGGPAVLIGSFGISYADYGFYAVMPPIGFLLGSFLSNRLTRRLGVNRMIALGGAVLIPTGVVMVALALWHVQVPYAVIGPMIFVCCGSGLLTPNATAGGIAVDPKIVGAAAALYGFLQMAGAAGAAALLSLGPNGSQLALATVIAGLGVLAVASFLWLARAAERAAPSPVTA